MGFGSVGLKRGRIKNSQKAISQLMEKINPFLVQSSFLDGAPFELISVIIRWGDNYSKVADIRKVDKRHKELPVAFEVPLDELRMESVEKLEVIYAKYAIQILRQVTEDFNLSEQVIDSLEQKFDFSDPTGQPISEPRANWYEK